MTTYHLRHTPPVLLYIIYFSKHHQCLIIIVICYSNSTRCYFSSPPPMMHCHTVLTASDTISLLSPPPLSQGLKALRYPATPVDASLTDGYKCGFVWQRETGCCHTGSLQHTGDCWAQEWDDSHPPGGAKSVLTPPGAWSHDLLLPSAERRSVLRCDDELGEHCTWKQHYRDWTWGQAETGTWELPETCHQYFKTK